MTQILDYAVIDGTLTEASEAQIPLSHPIFLSSFGVYETVKVDAGRAFHLRQHLERLHQSAQYIEMPLPLEVKTLAAWFQKLLELEPQATFTLRILALANPGPYEAPLVALVPEQLPSYPASFYRRGARAILYEGLRAIPQCKSLNTLVNYLARREAERNDALEAILFHAGQLTEGARSNVFAVLDGRLITPPLDRVLNGITREIVIRLMHQTGTPVDEAPLSYDSLAACSELFITSTSMHVMPISRINGRGIGDGSVGPITRQVMQQFEKYYRDSMQSER
ncbi:MAG: aminotransferase class IV [Anaerolineae bacterium]